MYMWLRCNTYFQWIVFISYRWFVSNEACNQKIRVCEASRHQLYLLRWFLGVGWHDPVTQTHKRHEGDGSNRSPELPIQVISHLYSAALVINLLRGWRLSTSESHWLFMRDKHILHVAGILSHKWPTCTVSVTCFPPLFARWHRICFSLPCYIFITAGPCWYSAGQKTWDHAQGLENMTSHVL